MYNCFVLNDVVNVYFKINAVIEFFHKGDNIGRLVALFVSYARSVFSLLFAGYGRWPNGCWKEYPV